MNYIITGAVCLIVGFVVGLLVYRKHGQKFEAEAIAAKAEAEAAYKEYKAALEHLKKVV